MWRKWMCGFALSAAMGTASVVAAVTDVTKQSDGIVVKMDGGLLRIEVMSADVIHVTYAAGETIPQRKSYSVVEKPDPGAKWAEHETGAAVAIETPALKATVERKTGAVTFTDAAGKLLLRETTDGREIAPAVQPGLPGTFVRQSFALPADEAIYGLGQHQQGVWNYRGHTVRLLQENREVGIPVIFSSKGYGLLWDNPAVTEVSVGAPLASADKNSPAGAGENVVRWSSEVGKAIDYYFVYGGHAAGSMRAYRTLTGEAPLMPEWLFGFWQCKERYRTQEEVLGAARQYRDLGVPIDGMIQDWRYWPDNSWGSHQFDPSRYPDPSALTRQLHDLHFHILISVWPKFDVGTANFEELEKAGALFDPVIPYVFPPGKGKWYDPFSPAGRELYWQQISREIFAHGFDGWWLDAPEPELSGKWGEFRNFRTSVGPGATVFNAYPLMHSTGIYQGQRAQTDEKRVVILTRSAYAGQQRNSAITWSGDIGSSWQVLRAQIPAGLNFSLSGIPYWNTDIGGFSGRMDPNDPKYEELFARWFEFGSFCPMFRVHGSAPADGTGPGKEYWWFDPATQAMWRKFVELRYRLMPYSYSTAWQVTSAGAAIMRPLVMDFADDQAVLDIGDQYLFGPALLVNPVTTAGAKSRSIYLPGDAPWYDFWTGKREAGHQRIDAAAPVESMPLYVRSGSIIPMGPSEQYVGETTDPVEVRVYRGADGAFTLYEDEGDTYHYEKGVRATIPMKWDDKAGTFTIGKRDGDFPGMLKKRTFNVVFVDEQHGTGVGASAQVDQSVRYSGEAVSVKGGQ